MEVKQQQKRYKNNQTTKRNKTRGAGDKNIDKNKALKTANSQSNEIKSRTRLILLPLVIPVYIYRFILSAKDLYCLNRCFLYSCSENELV